MSNTENVAAIVSAILVSGFAQNRSNETKDSNYGSFSSTYPKVLAYLKRMEEKDR